MLYYIFLVVYTARPRLALVRSLSRHLKALASTFSLRLFVPAGDGSWRNHGFRLNADRRLLHRDGRSVAAGQVVVPAAAAGRPSYELVAPDDGCLLV